MDKEQMAITRLKEAARMSERVYQKPLIITTSGGKDSSVLLELALRAGIDFELMHNHTTVDTPETVRFVRAEYRRLSDMGMPEEQLIVNYPHYKGVRTSMWALIPQKLMPPTRIVRYCCSVLKERGGQGRYIATGVRWAESNRRRNTRGIYETANADPSKRIILNNDNDERRRLFETCSLQHKAICNPIIDWEDAEIWDFIHSQKIPVNPLYDRGFHRIGCVGCPMARRRMREREFALYPGYKKCYIRAFDRMLEERRRRGKMEGTWNSGNTGEDIFHWWMEDGFIAGQIDLFEAGGYLS